MTRAVSAFLVVLTLVASALVAQWRLHEPAHPPHVEPPVAAVIGPTPLAAVGGDIPMGVIEAAEAAYAAAIAEAIYARMIEEAIYGALIDEALARMAATRARAGSGVAAPRGGIAVECGNTVLPEHIVWRESRGQCDAYNAAGCGGRGCIGYAQLDVGHFWAVSPWNPSVPGSCYGLSYNECVERLWADGAGASHWGQ